ncbi:hypothetical protein CK203_082946 [Vitis vinifera]|uniref:Reverse transcriptase zinc-binding domain-containing protein n=1 Tax=Vitis vinifera TaxID=29760 RepID=A0A438DEH4_VITVI|nr:hypothetical protein CK203_082946 [Vitis vinifera]
MQKSEEKEKYRGPEGLLPRLCNPTGGGGRRRRRRRRRRRSAYLVGPSEATRATASRLAGGERLACLSGAFVKGVASLQARRRRVASRRPEPRRAFQNYGWVKASRGLRQGDPLSPFLFTLVADVMSRMLMRAEERNMMEGFRGGRAADSEESFVSVWAHLWAQGVWMAYSISGSPFGGNPKACGFWDPVVERISSRLDGWQKAYLSFGGRITLIQSCLSHLPRVGEGKRDHLVRWDIVCKPKTIGGLGLGNISWRNLALLGNGYGGNGIEFGSGKTCGGGTNLGNPISKTIQSSRGQNISISSVLGPSRPFLWNLNFRRNLSDSEIEDLEGLMRSLDDLYLSPSNFPSKFVWNSRVPFKVKSFVWLVAHKKVNTNDMLQVRRPYKALSPDICILCIKHGESADHLFLHCSLTIGLWHRLFQLAKMDWVSPRSIYDMMSIKLKASVILREG